MTLDIDTVYRDSKIKGDPHSGANEPDKAEIRALLKAILNAGGQAVTRNTLAALNGVTPPNENLMGAVLNDPNPANNGYYSRSGGAWVFGRGFPDTFARVALSGSGTAQTGVVQAGVNPASIEVFFAKVATDNTGAMTLSISGEAPKPVVNLAGNPLSAGEWTGMVMFYLNDANQYQLLIDAGAAAAAAQSASEAGGYKDDAEDAADRAELAASGVEYPVSYEAQALSNAQKSQSQKNIGSYLHSVVNDAANHTVDINTEHGAAIAIDSSGGNRTVSLPAAATAGNGFKIVIKKADDSQNTVTVNPDGAEEIDGEASKILRIKYQSVALFCDGTTWHVFDEGAVFEVGENANGFFMRYANGFQRCWTPSIVLTASATSLLQASWTLPAPLKDDTPASTHQSGHVNMNIVSLGDLSGTKRRGFERSVVAANGAGVTLAFSGEGVWTIGDDCTVSAECIGVWF
jgi:hypothetical protein